MNYRVLNSPGWESSAAREPIVFAGQGSISLECCCMGGEFAMRNSCRELFNGQNRELGLPRVRAERPLLE
jgi:hypothetical protein